MPEWLEVLLRWLQATPLGEAVRGTPFMYPTLEALHILGIALLVGPAFGFDLRLLGVGRRVMSVTAAARYLLPLSHVGLIIAILTGVALISAHRSWSQGLLPRRGSSGCCSLPD